MADFEGGCHILLKTGVFPWKGDVGERKQRLQAAVEQCLGPFLEEGALDDLVIDVVQASTAEGRRKHLVQLSGIPGQPEGPLSLRQAKQRIIDWAHTRRAAAAAAGEAPAARAVEEMLERHRAKVAESLLDPASRQLLTQVRDIRAAMTRQGQQVPAELATLDQLLQRAEAKLLFHGSGSVAAPFGKSAAGKSYLLSQVAGGLMTHHPCDVPPQQDSRLMDRAGTGHIKTELRHVQQDVLEETAAALTITVHLPASYLETDPEEEGALKVTLERRRNRDALGEYQQTGQLEGYDSWLPSQTGMPTTSMITMLKWGDTHQLVFSIATRDEVAEVMLEVQRVADSLLQQAAEAASSKTPKKSACSSRRAAALLQELKDSGVTALQRHLLAGGAHPGEAESLKATLARYAELCGPALQWDGDVPQLDKQQLRMKPEVEDFLGSCGGKFINFSSWPGPPGGGGVSGAGDPWQLPPQGLADARDACMCDLLRVVQGCATEEVRQRCLPALRQAGIPDALLEADWGKAPLICALLKYACRFCPSEPLAGGLTLLEVPGAGVNNAQHNALAREALSRRITQPVLLFSREADGTILQHMQRDYHTHALINILEAAARRPQEAPADPGRLHLAEQLAAPRREPLLVSCLEADGISLTGSGTTVLTLGAVAEHLPALVAKEGSLQQTAARLFETQYLGVLLTNVDQLLEEGRGIPACIRWLRAYARTGRMPADDDDEEEEEDGAGVADRGGEDEEDSSSSSDEEDDGSGGDSGMRGMIKRVAKAAVRGAGHLPEVAQLRRSNAAAALRRLLRPPVMNIYPSLVFSTAVNPGHAATLTAEGVNVEAALQHISTGMAQLLGQLTSTTPEQLQEVVEELATGLEQHLAALGCVVQGMQRWKLPRAYANRKSKQPGQAGSSSSKAPGPNPAEAGDGTWRDVKEAINAFCSGTARVVPRSGGQQPLTTVVLRQRLKQLVEGWGERAEQRLEAGRVAAEVNRMGRALQEQFVDGRQLLHQFNRSLALQRAAVGRDPNFDIMSLLRDEVFNSQQEGGQLLGALLREVEQFALGVLAPQLVERLLSDLENAQRPPRFLLPPVRAALSAQLLQVARAQLQDVVEKFNVVGNNSKMLSAQEVDRHVTQVLEDALLELFANAREAAAQAVTGAAGSSVAAGSSRAARVSPPSGRKRPRGTTRNPQEQVKAMLEAVVAGLPEVVERVSSKLADKLWGTLSRGVGTFGDALGWGPSLRRKNTQRQMLLLTHYYNELLRRLRDMIAGDARTKKGAMRKQLTEWRARVEQTWREAQQQPPVDPDLLPRLASAITAAELPRAPGIGRQQAQDLLQALGQAAAGTAAVQRGPLTTNKHAAAAWKQRDGQPPMPQREDQEEGEAELEDPHLALLDEVLQQHGRQRVPTLGNGQCMANALLMAVHGVQLPLGVLQHMATGLVRSALARLQGLYWRDAGWRERIDTAVLGGDFPSFPEYVAAYTANPFTWGDHLLLQGMLEELGIGVVLCSSTASGVSGTEMWPSTVDDGTASPLDPYIIGFSEPASGLGHYEAVLPIAAAAQQQEAEGLEEAEPTGEQEEEGMPALVGLDEEEGLAEPAAMEVEADAAADATPAAGPAAAAAEAGSDALAEPADTFREAQAAVATSLAAPGPSQPAAVGQQVPSKGQRARWL